MRLKVTMFEIAGHLARAPPPVRTVSTLVSPKQVMIAENGGRHELRLEPSVARPQIYSCIGSRHWAGMVLEKRAVQIAIDWRSGRNSAAIQVGASIYA